MHAAHTPVFFFFFFFVLVHCYYCARIEFSLMVKRIVRGYNSVKFSWQEREREYSLDIVSLHIVVVGLGRRNRSGGSDGAICNFVI